jgi:two-component system, LytTR family, response regulator
MQSLTLHRDFLKQPSKGISPLIAVIVLAYITLLATRNDIITEILQKLSFVYVCRLVFGTILPEIISLLILVALINGYHLLMKLEKVEISIDAIACYELKFVPLFVSAFFFFFPITLHVRFLLREFPHYTLASYYNIYLINGFSVSTYLFYLPFIFILGYALLNISMFFDFSRKSSFFGDIPVETIEQTPEIIEQSAEVIEQNIEFEKEVTHQPYLTAIQAKTAYGTVFFDVKDCYYFILISSHQYAVGHPEGRFKITKSISILEQELDPIHFFRCNRKAIINLNYTGSFVYLDKGKYNVCMKSPIVGEFDISKARIEVLKEALKINIESK